MPLSPARAAAGAGRFCLAALLAVALLGPWPALARPPAVVLLSWDGVRHDLPARAALPGLERMAREGARAQALVPPFPSNTFPAHVALATGAHPDRHGIVGNRFVDRERGLYRDPDDASWIEAEPLWVAAERQGVVAAVLFWVGSSSDWRGRGPTHRRVPFDPELGEQEKVRQILAWLDLPDATRPRLVMSWWRGVDRVAHGKGPDHPDVDAQLADQDRALQQLLLGLDARDAWGHLTLLVVSDHGMARADRAVDAQARLDAAGLDARVVPGGGMAHVYLGDAADAARARAALAGLPGVRAYLRDEIPRRLRVAHPRRCGDLLLLAQPPTTLYPSPALRRLADAAGAALLDWRPGGHGYDPAAPEMAGILLALGRGAPPGAGLGRPHAVDVAPTVARLLGIEPPRHAEGRALLAPP